MMIPIIGHHLQVDQEPAHPPRLQGETWRIGVVLTYDTISRFIRNLHLLQDAGRDLEDRWSLDRVLLLDLDETFAEASEV